MTELGSINLAAYVVTDIIEDDSDIIDEENAINNGEYDKIESYDIRFNSYLNLNLDHRRYNGTWWYLGGYSPNYDNVWPLTKSCNRIKYIYKWDNINKKFDIDNYCYTKYPNIHRVKIYDITFPNKYIDLVIPNTGKYKIIKSKAISLDDRHPRKLILDYNKDNKIPNFYIYKTDYCNYSIVGTPNKKGLWILIRKYRITSLQAKRILDEVRELKFDINKIISVKSTIIKK